MNINTFLSQYEIDDLFALEKIEESRVEYDIETQSCDEKSLVTLHNQSKMQFPSYMLRFASFTSVPEQSDKVLCVVMESGSENAFNELKKRLETNLYNAPDEFLVIASQKENGLEVNILTEIYEPIVSKIINRVERRYFFRGLEKDDLLQEAFIGFLKAVEVYKVERRTKFRDFSRHVIERHLGTLMNRSKNLRNRALNESFSYNMPVNTNNETTFEDLLEGVPILPEDIFLNKEMCDEIKNKLTENEEEVLAPYSEGYSYEEIAYKLIDKKGLIDFAGLSYKQLSAAIKKNEAFLGTKQTNYLAIAHKLIEKESPFAEGLSEEQLVIEIKQNLEFENSNGMTFKMLADEIKKKKKSVDNTIQRIRNKGIEHRETALNGDINGYHYAKNGE